MNLSEQGFVPRMPAIIYARYSSDNQNPLSCRDQVYACRSWAAAQDPPWEILETFHDDAISGTLGRESREGFDNLLAFVEAGHLPSGGAVLVFELDRFSREYATGMIEMLRLSQAGVHMADTSSGLLKQDDMAGQLRAFLGFLTASDWIKKHSRHVRRGIRSRVEQGYFFGKPPFGYQKRKTDGGPTLEPAPNEAQHLIEMFAMAAAGKSSATIARHLATTGVPTRGGGTWLASTVRAILCNPTYTGKIVQYAAAGGGGGRKNRYSLDADQVTVYPGKHPALVDDATYAKIRCQYSNGSQSGRRRPRKYALSGLLTCAECGRSAIIVRQKPRTYRCHTGSDPYSCKSTRLVRLSDLEEAVRAWAMRLANDSHALDLSARKAVLAEWEQAQRMADSRAPIESDIAEIERTIAATFKLVEAGNAPAIVNRRLDALEKRLSAAHAQLKDIGRVVEPIPVEAAREAFQERLRAGVLDLHQLRGLIERIQMPADPEQEIVLEAGGSKYQLGVLRPRGRWG